MCLFSMYLLSAAALAVFLSPLHFSLPLATSLDTVTPIPVSGCSHGNAADVPGNLLAE